MFVTGKAVEIDMKKIITVLMALALFITGITPLSAFASDGGELENASFSREELEALEYVDAEYDDTRAIGLILDRNLNIVARGNTMLITGFTSCASGVVKCGFQKLTIQIRKTGTTAWNNQGTYDDLYADGIYHSLTKVVSIGTGYQYRVVAIHYAKKNILSTQKIEATTGYLAF